MMTDINWITRQFIPSVLALAVVSGCSSERPAVSETTPRVKYFVVGEKATGQSRRISGKVVSANESPLAFGIAGTVEEVLVNLGDDVREDQILARLDPKPIQLNVDQARSELSTQRAELQETKLAYDRANRLYAAQAGSLAELERAKTAHATARSKVEQASASLELAKRDLSRTALTAPFSGKISERSVDPFQDIGAGTVAFVLQTADALEVDVRVPETLIRDVDFGQVVSVSFPTAEGVALKGTVSEIGSRAESGNAFPVSIRLPENDAALLPGMTAGVTFNFDDHLQNQNVYLMPLAAIAIDAGAATAKRRQLKAGEERLAPVYVINDQSELEVRKVKVGDIRGNELEIFSGLEAGDRVVSAGVALLRDGMKVDLWDADVGLDDD